MSKKVIPLSSELKNSTSPFDIISEISKSDGSLLNCQHNDDDDSNVTAPGQKVNNANPVRFKNKNEGNIFQVENGNSRRSTIAVPPQS